MAGLPIEDEGENSALPLLPAPRQPSRRQPYRRRRHRDPQAASQALKKALAEALKELGQLRPKELVEARLERLMAYGKFKEAAER